MRAANPDRPPLISVCIANYNGEKFLSECIESVLNQVASPHFEIIVHDDASTDASLEQIARYDNIKLIRSPENVGYCVANNRMAEAAFGEYLLLLNNDAVLQPDALATLLSSATAIAAPAILGLPQYDYYSHELIDAGARLDIFMSPVPVTTDRSASLAMVIGACLWIPRALWNELGGFPDWFHTNAEDVYLCCQARLRGYRILVPMQSGYFHRVGATLSKRKAQNALLVSTIRRRYLSERNRTRLMVMIYPWWLLVPVLAIHGVTLLLEGIIVSVSNGNPGIFVQVYLQAIRDVGWTSMKLRSARASISNARKVRYCHFFRGFRIFPQKMRVLIMRGLPRIS